MWVWAPITDVSELSVLSVLIVQERKTPLMWAAKNDDAHLPSRKPVIVELLLKAKADVNAADKVSAFEEGMVRSAICVE